MNKLLSITTILLLISTNLVFASPSFIIRKGVNNTIVDNVLKQVDLYDYNGFITFNNYLDEKVLAYFYFTYMYNIKTFKTWNYKYNIQIYSDAYMDEEVLTCTLKHELAHYKQMKENKVYNFTLTEEYADENGCSIEIEIQRFTA